MKKILIRVLVKFALVILIIVFALFNCKYQSFKFGSSTVSVNHKDSYSEVISTIQNIDKIEYYKKDILTDSYKYKVYITTDKEAYLLNATDADITQIELAGATKVYDVQEISPVPFYFEIMLAIFIIFYPSRSDDEDYVIEDPEENPS